MIRSEITKASAGSGKTFSLTDRVFRLLQTKNPFIIALTFTRAATAEMRNRILGRIDECKADYIEKLGLIMRAGGLNFATFDSFFYLLLATEYDSLQIADEKETELIREEIKRGFFGRVHRFDRVEELIIASRLLRTSIEGLVERIDENQAERFRKNRISEGEFLRCVGETAKIKGDIRELLDRLKAVDAESVPARVKKSVLELSGLPPEDLSKRSALTQRDLSEYTYLGKHIDWSSSPFREINEIFCAVRSRLADYLIHRALLQELTVTEMYALYTEVAEAIKGSKRKVFFSDILERLIDLDGRDAELRANLMNVYFELGLDRVQHLMVDEFQDTSSDNMTLLMPLVEEVMSEVDDRAEGERSIFVVGDWKQMIYGWRGANRESVERGLSRYQGKQLKDEMLPHNWRSTPLLVDLFNRVVSTIFSGSERGELQSVPAEKSYSGFSEINLIQVASTKGKEPLYDLVVETLERKREEWGCDLSEITLLFRTNTEKEAVAQKLAGAGIGFAEVKGRQILASEEGVAVFALLAHLFTDEPGTLVQRTIELSSYGSTLKTIAEGKEEFLGRYARPFSLLAISDVLELCRGSIPEAVIETYQEEAESFFREGGADAAEFLSYLFRVRNRVTVPEPEHSERVKLATIHGTKGLEFKHVFLLWLDHARPFPFYLGEYRCHVTFNQDEMGFFQSLDTPLARSVCDRYGEERERLEREKANVLYVAMTRATHTLTIFVKEGAGDELTQRLVSVVDAGPFEAECRREGGAVGWRKDYGRAEKRCSKETVEIPEVSIPAAGGVRHRERELDRSRISRSVREGIERGERIHSFLSRLREPSRVPERHSLSAEEMESVSTFLRDETVSQILFRHGRTYIEQPISNRDFYGVVDRMILGGELITLIDYKTGSAADELLEGYREQVQGYCSVLSELFPDKAIEAYLLFVDEPDRRVVRVYNSLRSAPFPH